MASEILSNLQLGSLIFNATKVNALSATSGAFISAPSVTVTDSATAASGTLTQFNAHYLAAPTLAAASTGVTTNTANTLTIGGAPTAGTNETITNSYALNVLGATNFGGSITAPTTGLNIINNLRTCYGKAMGNGSGSISCTGNQSGGTPVILAQLGSGSTGVSYSTSTGLFTIVTSGTYEVSCMLTLGTATTCYTNTLINGNNVDATYGRVAQIGGSGGGVLVGTNLFPLTAGQTIGLTVSPANSTSLGNYAQDTYWWIRKVA